MLMELPKNLRDERERRNWTQKHLSEIIGVKASTYSNWEQGTREPNLQQLISLANLYELSLDQLVGRKYNPKPDQVLQQFIAEVQVSSTQKRNEIIKYWNYINQN